MHRAHLLSVFAEDPSGGFPVLLLRSREPLSDETAAALAADAGRETIALSGEPGEPRVRSYRSDGSPGLCLVEAMLAALHVLNGEGVARPSLAWGRASYPGRLEAGVLWAGVPVERPCVKAPAAALLRACGLEEDDAAGDAELVGDALLIGLRDHYLLETSALAADWIENEMRELGAKTLLLHAATASPEFIEARAFDAAGLEVPSCARACAALADLEARRRGRAVSLLVSSGAAAGRPSLVRLRCAESAALRIWVGGDVVSSEPG